MNTNEKLEKITIEYEDKLFDIFKNIIDTSTMVAIEEEMEPIDKYAYVNKSVQNAFSQLASIQGLSNNEPNISDSLNEKIYDYYDPLAQEARIDIQNKIDNIMDSEYLEELIDKLNSLKAELENKGLSSYFYEKRNIKKKYEYVN